MPVHKQSCQGFEQQSLALDTDRRFFKCLLQHGPMSRAAISQLTGISRPTISEAAQRLKGQSLVNETKRKTQNKQGRAGILYEINAMRGVTLAVALDSAHIQMRLMDLAENVISEQHSPLSDVLTQEAFLGRVTQMAEDLVRQVDTVVLSVGISIADPVDANTGLVVPLPEAPFPLSHNINFCSLFSNLFHCPVTIDNDVNWATLAERAQGNAKDEQNFVFFYFGRGIGAGIHISGHLLRGSSGMAGEVGYFKVDGDTNLQDFVESQGLLKALLENRSLKANLAIDKIVHVISSTAILVNPDLVILGGPLARHDAFMAALMTKIPENTLVKTRVMPSAMPETAPLCGASAGAQELALASLGLLPQPE
mgnify:FL=1